MYEGSKIVFQEYGDFFGKFCAPFFIHLLDKLHKNVGQNIPWIFLIPWQGISSFSSFLTRNFKPRKMQCVCGTEGPIAIYCLVSCEPSLFFTILKKSWNIGIIKKLKCWRIIVGRPPTNIHWLNKYEMLQKIT